MSKSSLFKLYNASAGSGKTFNLVKEYLLLLLNSDDIFFNRKILSITFTNKAVKEKKGRILNYLADFSQGNFSEKNMSSLILSETGLNENERWKCAGISLLLHCSFATAPKHLSALLSNQTLSISLLLV